MSVSSSSSSSLHHSSEEQKYSSWPVLKRVHILALSGEATKALFPDITENGLSSSTTCRPEVEPIIRHLSRLLKDVPKRFLPMQQYQTFVVDQKVYVVVDMETAEKGRPLCGLITFSTSINTGGGLLECLSSLHVCLVRPFSEKKVSTTASASSTTISPSTRAFSFRRFLSQHEEPADILASSSIGHSDSLIRGPVAVSLKALLEVYLSQYPCLAFSPGQQIQLPLPQQLANFEVLQPNPPLRSPTKTLSFFVYSTSCSTPGVIIPNYTNVTVELDPIGEFNCIYVSPVVDTVPQSYEFDFFNDYIKPFVETNPFRLLYRGSLFSYHGVQFKVQRTKPSRRDEIEAPDCGRIYWKAFCGQLQREQQTAMVPESSPLTSIVTGITEFSKDSKREWDIETERLLNRTIMRRGCVCRRIGKITRIYRSDPVQPQLRDILPPVVMEEVLRLPTRLQSVAAIHAIADLAPQDLIRILGIAVPEPSIETSQQQLRQQLVTRVLSEFATIYNAKREINVHDSTNSDSCPGKHDDNHGPYDEDSVCIVCLVPVDSGDQVLELPCSHVFHLTCVEEWLRRSLVCPVCKRDVRDFLSEQVTTESSVRQ